MATPPKPIPIAMAPKAEALTLLLWCPEHGGWQTGELFEDGWRSTAKIETPLDPTVWLPCSPRLEEGGTEITPPRIGAPAGNRHDEYNVNIQISFMCTTAHGRSSCQAYTPPM